MTRNLLALAALATMCWGTAARASDVVLDDMLAAAREAGAVHAVPDLGGGLYPGEDAKIVRARRIDELLARVAGDPAARPLQALGCDVVATCVPTVTLGGAFVARAKD